MEGNVFDVFRLLSLVVTWAVPALLIVAVAVFIVTSPLFALGGLITKWYEFFHARLPSRTQAEKRGLNLVCSTHTDCPPGFLCENGRCVPEKA